MVAVPVATPVTRPVVPTLAIVEFEVDQKALFVSVLVEPSLKVPVAVICNVLPWTILGVEGPTVKVDRVGLTKKPVHPIPGINARITISPLSNWNPRLCFMNMLESPLGCSNLRLALSINCSREISRNARRADMYQSAHRCH